MSDTDDLNSSLTSVDWIAKISAKDLKISSSDLPTSEDLPDFELIHSNSNGSDQDRASIGVDPMDPTGKPPHSYASLIRLAIENSPLKKATLSEIYHWIVDQFPFYKKAQPGWKNSIRHNLSLKKNFRKVQRAKGDPGKGCYWEIDTSTPETFSQGHEADSRQQLSYHTGKPRAKKARVNDTQAGLAPPTMVNPLQMQKYKSENDALAVNPQAQLPLQASNYLRLFLSPEQNQQLAQYVQGYQNPHAISLAGQSQLQVRPEFSVTKAPQLYFNRPIDFSLAPPSPSVESSSSRYFVPSQNPSPQPQPDPMDQQRAILNYLNSMRASQEAYSPNDQLNKAIRMAGIDPSAFGSHSPEPVQTSTSFPETSGHAGTSLNQLMSTLHPVPKKELSVDDSTMEQMENSVQSHPGGPVFSGTPSPSIGNEDNSYPPTPSSPPSMSFAFTPIQDMKLPPTEPLSDHGFPSGSDMESMDDASLSNCVNPADVFIENRRPSSQLEGLGLDPDYSQSRRRSSTRLPQFEGIDTHLNQDEDSSGFFDFTQYVDV